MKKIFSIFDFFIKSSLHLSFCVLSLIVITYLRLDQEINFLILFVVFNATVITYNFIKYASTLPYYFFVSNISIKKIQYLSFVCGIFLIISLFFLKFNTILFGFFLSFFCFIYVIPFNRTKRNIRNYSRIKIFIVAFVWASVTVWFPLTINNEIDYLNSFLVFLQRFVFVVAYTLPFEIRDLKYDSIKLETIPQLYGIILTKKIAYFLLILFVAITFIIQPFSVSFIIGDLLIALLTSLMILKTKENQKKYFASFWVESIPLVWLLLIVFLTQITF